MTRRKRNEAASLTPYDDGRLSVTVDFYRGTFYTGYNQTYWDDTAKMYKDFDIDNPQVRQLASSSYLRESLGGSEGISGI